MSQAEKFWDRIANYFEKQPIKDVKAFQNSIENIKKHLTTSDIVLDYACGTGTISNDIAFSVKGIHAIDISSKMIAFAIEKAAALNIENIQHRKTTLFDKSLETTPFDAVVAFNILHLSEDMQAVIRRINQLLKPEGLLISSTPCLGKRPSLSGMFESLVSNLGIVPNLNRPTFSELENNIQNNGFQIIEVEKPEPRSHNHFLVAQKL